MINSSGIKDHPVVSHEEWLSARTAFLAKEKEFTRLRDELTEQRRALPCASLSATSEKYTDMPRFSASTDSWVPMLP